MKALVADPAVPVSAALRKHLEGMGFEVKVVHYLDEAVERIRAGELDLVVAAVTASFDGETPCRKAKSLLPSCPVVLVYPPEEDDPESHAARAGADGWLVGPVKRVTVVSAVRMTLRVRQMQAHIDRLEAELRTQQAGGAGGAGGAGYGGGAAADARGAGDGGGAAADAAAAYVAGAARDAGDADFGSVLAGDEAAAYVAGAAADAGDADFGSVFAGDDAAGYGADAARDEGGAGFGSELAGDAGGAGFGSEATGDAGGAGFGSEVTGDAGGAALDPGATGDAGGAAFGSEATGGAGGAGFGLEATSDAGDAAVGSGATGDAGGAAHGTGTARGAQHGAGAQGAAGAAGDVDEARAEALLVPPSPGANTADFEFFKKFLLMEVKRSRRYRYPVALLLVALDGFPDRAAGMAPATRKGVLAEALTTVSRCVRDIDLVVPFADERFLVFLPHTTRDGALTVAGRLRDNLAALKSLPENTASVGAATFEPGGTPTPGAPHVQVSFGSLMKEATDALKRAQAQGGNAVDAGERKVRDRISLG